MSQLKKIGVADLRYESSFVGFLKPRPKLTFGWVQGCHSYLDSATPKNRKVIRLRLSNDPNKVDPFANDFEEIFGQRQKEADAFYEAITPFRISDSDEELQIQRQAFAGMLWNKQFYYYVVQDWLQGDFLYHRHRIYPDHEMPKPDKRNINSQWTHLHNKNIIAVPVHKRYILNAEKLN